MAVDEPTALGIQSSKASDGIKDGSKVIPGTTFPPADQGNGQIACKVPQDLSPQPGPPVNGQPTTATLYTPTQIAADAGIVIALRTLINQAFSTSHEKYGAMPGTIDRLQSPQQLITELGSDDNATFTYVLTSSLNGRVLATASGKRWIGKVQTAEPLPGNKGAFIRYGAESADAEQWELSTMAVDPSLQRQGLAAWLMRMVEAEIKRRWDATSSRKEGLVLLLTTLKEINGEFYAKRGFGVDYEKRFPPGWLQSEKGFGVIHMSRRLV